MLIIAQLLAISSRSAKMLIIAQLLAIFTSVSQRDIRAGYGGCAERHSPGWQQEVGRSVGYVAEFCLTVGNNLKKRH